MQYEEVRIGDSPKWLARPANWAELAYSLSEGPWLMPYNPNNVEVKEDLAKLFL